ncbi:MAG: YSC84-related protein [Bacteroidota bacterium]|nr:YSC84-related protein [Bacteroidota bacterium]
MKRNNIIRLVILTLTVFILPHSIKAQDEKGKQKILSESQKAHEAFIKKDPSMSKLFTNSVGYVIFPKIDKAGFVVGGSGGAGAVYEKGKAIGTAKVAQVSVGAQVGAQTYREVIFFENKDVLDRFKDNKVEFSAQLSAVAVKSGVSANAKYADGVAIFTDDLSGLMAEAAVGGQKFTYKSL